MRTVFVIDGGAGRVLTAVPALLKFAKNNPQDDFRVCIHGWDTLLWGIPELQDRTFNIDNKAVFENVFLPATNVISPEPYRLPAYYKQEKNLIESFDSIINNTDEHSDLPNLTMPLNKAEEINATLAISEMLKNEDRRNKLNIIVQPWGSTAKKLGSYVVDDSSRSLEPWTYIKLVKKLSEKYNLIYFGDNNLLPEEDTHTVKFEGDLRFWSAMISSCDYFLGVDSVGQHMARAFDKPGTVIMGSTFEKNVSYPDHFHIFRNGVQPTYSPIRIGGIDSEFADRMNDSVMDFTDFQLNMLCDKVTQRLAVWRK